MNFYLNVTTLSPFQNSRLICPLDFTGYLPNTPAFLDTMKDIEAKTASIENDYENCKGSRKICRHDRDNALYDLPLAFPNVMMHNRQTCVYDVRKTTHHPWINQYLEKEMEACMGRSMFEVYFPTYVRKGCERELHVNQYRSEMNAATQESKTSIPKSK
jgi:hypothetical protein